MRAPVGAFVARPKPQEEVRTRLRPLLGDRVGALPVKWELRGDVAVVRLGAAGFSGDEARAAAAVYADVLGMRIVFDERGGIRGALREPDLVRLHGEGAAETEVLQDGIRYRFDAERVMWSSGNVDERLRMGRVDARGETVADLFAGIGYFTLPLLVHSGAARAVACELNPLAARYLRANADGARVAERIEVREGDCRGVAPNGVADRVVQGYFPHGHRFLDVALRCLRPEGGIVHYHDTVGVDRFEAEMRANFARALVATPFVLRAAAARVVKSHSPGMVHAVLDAEVRA